jgi:hypothetical protein
VREALISKGLAKLEQLMEMLPEMVAEGRRILLFSQFTTMLTLIEAELKKRNIRWVKLTGASQNRDALIEQFTSGQVPIFLISLKAGGVGLNLPQATNAQFLTAQIQFIYAPTSRRLWSAPTSPIWSIMPKGGVFSHQPRLLLNQRSRAIPP